MKVSFPRPASASVLIATLFLLKVSIVPAQTSIRILPSPPYARQAKIQTAVLTEAVSRIVSGQIGNSTNTTLDGSVLGTHPLYQAGNVTAWDNRFTVMYDNGAGYGDFGNGYAIVLNPSVTFVSAEGGGASAGAVDETVYGTIDPTFLRIGGGSGYLDDVTAVVTPPRTNDLQAALDDLSIDTIELSAGVYFQNVVITRDLTIRGQGQGRSFISGGLLGSVVHVQPGKTLHLEDLTLFDGLATNGGGIYNDGGVVFVDRCEIRDCRAYGLGGQGGGIFNRGTAILTLTDCFVHNNIAAHEGGGISSSGINTSLLPAVAGALETPANSLSRFYSELATMRQPDPSASIEGAFNAAWDQHDAIMQGFEGFGSATNIFTSLGSDFSGSNTNWNAFGLPVTLITNTIVSNNQAGKGNGTATVTEYDCQIGDAGPGSCDYLPSQHSIRLLAWGAGIHNELGLLILDHATVTQNTTGTDFGSLGGGLSSFFGVVRATQSTIANNTVNSSTILASGGAVHSFASVVEIVDSALTNNAVNALFLSSGGAIKSTALTFLDVKRTPMIGNTSGGGGGVANDYLSLGYIRDCNLSSNIISGVVGADGGGVRNEQGGNVLLIDCTLSFNSAKGLAHGGGLYNQCEASGLVIISTATLVNCTISGNTIDGTGKFGIPLEAFGAGLYNGSAQDGIANLFLTSCTIVSNNATGGLIGPLGGGFYNSALSNIKLNVFDTRLGTSLVEIANNLFAYNSPDDCFNNFLTINALTVSIGYNLDTDGSGAVAAFPSDELLGSASFLKVTNALLSPLQFNGGYTPTHALLPGSPAIDHGSTPGTLAEKASLSTDQRGVDRSLGGRRDIGSFETVPPMGSPDSFTAIENQQLIVSAPGVLVTDIATAAQAQLVSPPANGALQLQANGGFTYTPATNFNGTDSFIYRVVDASGTATSNLTVTITVIPRLNLLSVVPAAGSLAQHNANVVLTFDQPVTADAISQAVALIGSQSGSHNITVSSNGNVVTLAPQPDFFRGEQVTVSISPELQSAAGWPIWPAPSDTVYSIFTNRAPVIVPQTYTMLEDTLLTVSSTNSLLSNDSDPDGDPFFVSDIAWRANTGDLGILWLTFGFAQNFTFENGGWVFVQPVPLTNSGLGGTLSVGADGTFVFQPTNHYHGVFTFDYHVTDSLGAISAPATVTINITSVNHAPIANNDFYNLYTTSIPAIGGVLANDIDVDGNPLTAVLDTQPSHGSVRLNPDGSFVYTPVVGYYGPDVFTYHAYDGQSSSASARVKIGNTPPAALPDAYPATAGQTLSVTATNGVLANDSDAEGDPLTAQLVSPPSYGSLTLNADGSFTYVPNTNFAGGDIFFYQASDGLANSASVRVKLGDTAPIAENDSGYNALTGRPLVVTNSILANDSDPDQDPLTAGLVTAPGHGIVSLNSDGTFTYISAIGFEGNDSFTYSANDGSLNSTPATVTIHVSDILRVLSQTPARNSDTGATNDPVVVNFNFPIDSASITGKFILHGSMSGRHSLNPTVNGAQVTLTPVAGFQPGEVVTVWALTGIQSISNAVLSPTYISQYVVAASRGGTNFTSGGAPDSTPHKSISVALGDLDGDGYPDAFVVNQTDYPVILLNNRDHTFTNHQEKLGTTAPWGVVKKAVLADFNGDGHLDVIQDGSAPDPIFGLTQYHVRVGFNDGTGHFPTFTDLPLTDGNQTHLPSVLAAGDFDGDGNIDVVAFDFSAGWILRNDGTGNFTFSTNDYIPTAGIVVQDVVVGDANNDGLLDLFISGSGGAAVLLNDGTGHFTLNSPNLTTNTPSAFAVADFEGDSGLDVALVPGFPYNTGILTNDGTGHFSARGQDLSSGAATAIAAGDLNGDGAPDLWLTTSSGDVLWINDGTGHFTKVPFLVGTNLYRGIAFADFDRDGDLDAFVVGDTTVSALNQIWYNQSPPKARDDFYAANGTNAVVVTAPGVLANDSMGDGGPMTAVLDSQPNYGTVVLNTNGSFTYTPGAAFAGADFFTYHAHDSLADSTSARVKIGNLTPTAQPDGPYIVISGTPFALAAPGVLTNAADLDDDPIEAILVSPPTNGIVTLKSDGSFVYVPFTGYNGTDSFAYEASDGLAASSVVTVSLDIRNPLILTNAQPTTNAVSVPLDTHFVLSFNHPLSAASIPGNVFLYAGETGARPFAYSLAGNTLTLSPNTNFRTGEKVTLSLGPTLEGTNGERQSAPLVLSFTAEAPLGEGQFVEGSQRIGDATNNVWQVLFGDLNGDGFVDAFIPSAGNIGTNPTPARVWFNDGTGHFVDSGQQLTNGFSLGGVLVDVDNDGDLDAIITSTVAPGATLWINDGTGHFTKDQQTFGNAGIHHLLCGDLNGDGAVDLVAVGDTNITIWLNDGHGHFTANEASFANVDFYNISLFNVALADLNSDGHLDLVIRQAFDPCHVLLNDGHAIFHDSGQTFGTGGSGLAIGDVNGDGYLDIIAPAPPSTSPSAPGHFLYVNDGTGHFTEQTQSFNTFNCTDVKLADVNGDGYLDAVVLQDSSSIGFSGITNLSRVYFNDGHGNFTPSPTIIGDFPPDSSGNIHAGSSIAVTDLENDGDLDLVFADSFRGPIQFWFNQSMLGPIKGVGSNIVINDNQTATPFSSAQLNAPARSSLTVSVTLDDAAKGVFTPTSLAAGGFTGPVNGVYTLSATNAAAAQAALRGLVYAPTPNRVPVGASEVTDFTISVTDGTTTRQDSSTTVTSVSVNFPPVAVDDRGVGFTTVDNAPFTTANVLTNDSDPDGDTFVIAAVDTSQTVGLVTPNGDGTFNYDPNGHFISLPVGAIGTDSFRYTIRDKYGAESTATVAITIIGINEPPVARDSFLTITQGSGPNLITAQVLANDTDPDTGDQALFVITSVDTNGTLGTVQLGAGNTLTYDPITTPKLPLGGTGADSFRYTLSDTHGGFATATVNITLIGINHPPVAEPDFLAMLANAPLQDITTNLLANDFDPDPGETASLTIVSVASSSTNEVLLLSTNAHVFYQPAYFQYLRAGQMATDIFNYVIQDIHGAVATGMVSVAVTGVQHPPTAVPDYLVFHQGDPQRDITTNILANDFDVDNPGSALVITAVVPAPNPQGTLTLLNGRVTYQPSPSLMLSNQQVVTDSFSYTISDVSGQTNSATNTMYIIGKNSPPVANAAAFSVNRNQVLYGAVTGSDPDGDPLMFALGVGPTNGTLTLNTDGSFVYLPNTNYYGSDSFSFKANDGSVDSPLTNVSITVIPVKVPPILASTPASVAVQYSDPIPLTTIAATEVDSPGSTLTATTAWETNGGPFQTGLPAGLSFVQAATTTNTRTWTISGTTQLAPGNYLIRVTCSDGQGVTNSLGLPLLVSQEDARVTYTGDLLVPTLYASNNLATITLSATIRDISAVTNDPATDPNPGDIRSATVTFINRANNSIIMSNLPVGLASASDTRTGTTTYQWNVDLGTNNSQTFTIGIIVSGFYTRNNAADNAVITVTKPVWGSSAYGSGYLVLSRPAGLISGEVGSKTDFGFSATSTKTGIQGNLSLVIRHSGHVYQVSAVQLTALAITSNHATLNGVATVVDTTSKTPVLIDDDATFQLQMTDNGTPGTGDTLAVTLWNDEGGLWFASNWDGTKAIEQNLAGGNLTVAAGTAPHLMTETAPGTTSFSLMLLPPSDTKPGRCTLQFQAEAGYNYVIESSADLRNWSDFKTVRSSVNQTYALEEPIGSGPRFYRVRRLPRTDAPAAVLWSP